MSTALPRPGLQQQARERWSKLATRERRLVGAGLAVVLVALVWFIGLQPALRTMREAPVQIDKLDAQLQQMQRLAAESRTLRTAPPVSTAQAQASLQASTARLGAGAQLSVIGDRATLRLSGVSGDALRAWLTEVRVAARARPVDVRLTRGPLGLTGELVVTLGGSS